MKNQMKEYREAYFAQDYVKAASILDKSDLKDDKKSLLLWHLEKGTVSLALNDEEASIVHFQAAVELIDRLYTKSLTTKAATFLINDASDVFYGANYERSYAHYFLAKSYYGRYLKSSNKLDLQGARATILAWDTYFVELQRSAPFKTLYQTDLMLKVFGAQIHELSQIRNDQQIALQLYKDALQILYTQGGIFAVFNKKSTEYIKSFESEGKAPPAKLYEGTFARNDLVNFLHFKILSLTKEIRSSDFENQAKTLKVNSDIKNDASNKGSGNVVLVLEEGLIPQKVGQPFNFGIKGAANFVGDSSAKKFIATVGVEALTVFAMNKLGLIPERAQSAGSFVFAHNVTRLAVQEAAIEFELPMIENVPLMQRLEVFILNDKGVVVQHAPLPVVSENGDIARVVLEEDIVARYVKTGSRVAIKHLVAIIAAFQVYNRLSADAGDFIAKSAALATYVGASKGIAALEQADTRNWSTLPQALRIFETKLPPGQYKVGVASYTGEKSPDAPLKIVGDIVVKDSSKTIFTLKFNL